MKEPVYGRRQYNANIGNEYHAAEQRIERRKPNARIAQIV
jgi:hypothetical protein